jgi:thiol:disulfide interchange protein
MPALEEAQRIQRPVFVEFHAEWCAPCKVMEEEIFTQPAVYSMLNNHFINFKVDFDQEAGRTIADIYEVSKLPTVLFLDTKGVVLERYTGGIGSATLLTNLANSALQKAK